MLKTEESKERMHERRFILFCTSWLYKGNWKLKSNISYSFKKLISVT